MSKQRPPYKISFLTGSDLKEILIFAEDSRDALQVFRVAYPTERILGLRPDKRAVEG